MKEKNTNCSQSGGGDPAVWGVIAVSEAQHHSGGGDVRANVFGHRPPTASVQPNRLTARAGYFEAHTLPRSGHTRSGYQPRSAAALRRERRARSRNQRALGLARQ
jgi:hypothetical protein